MYEQHQNLRSHAHTPKLTKVRHNMSQFCGANIPVAILIEHLERLLNLFLTIRVTHLPRHHREELREIDRAIAICIDLVDHVLQFGLCWVLAKRSHDGSELFGCDRAITICRKMNAFSMQLSSIDLWFEWGLGLRVWVRTFVKQREGFLELWVTKQLQSFH